MLNLQPSWVDKLNHNVTLRRPNFTPNRSSHLVAKELVVILASQPTYCWSGNLKLMTYSSLCTLTDRNFYQPMYGANLVLCYIGNDYMKCKSSTCTGWSGDWKQYMSEYSSWFQAQSNEDISAYSLCWMMNNMSAGQIFKGSTTTRGFELEMLDDPSGKSYTRPTNGQINNKEHNCLQKIETLQVLYNLTIQIKAPNNAP